MAKPFETEPPTAAVLWTGGKDSCQALHEVLRSGVRVARLVTFAPPGAKFLAHPLAIMARQAEAMGLEHHVIQIGQPYRESYRAAIAELRGPQGIGALVTGDIAEVGGMPNWIEECCRGLGVEVLRPLWGRGREELLEAFLSAGFRAVLSCVKRPWFTEDWLGAALDRTCVERLRQCAEETGLDLCGENGEYHTMVLDGPLFRRRVVLGRFTRACLGELMYLDVESVRLADKEG